MALGGKTADNGGKIRCHGPPGLGIPLIGMGPQGHHLSVEDIAAADADPTADCLQSHRQVRRYGAVAVHHDSQVIAQTGFPCAN